MTVDPGTLAWILIGLCIAGVVFSQMTTRAEREALLYWGAAIVLAAGAFGILHNLLTYGTLTTAAGG